MPWHGSWRGDHYEGLLELPATPANRCADLCMCACVRLSLCMTCARVRARMCLSLWAYWVYISVLRVCAMMFMNHLLPDVC